MIRATGMRTSLKEVDERHLYSYLEAIGGARVTSGALVGASEFHAFGGLDTGNDHGPVLHLHVRLQDGNVHEFAFLRAAAVGAEVVELGVPLVGSYEVLNGRIHDRRCYGRRNTCGIRLLP